MQLINTSSVFTFFNIHEHMLKNDHFSFLSSLSSRNTFTCSFIWMKAKVNGSENEASFTLIFTKQKHLAHLFSTQYIINKKDKLPSCCCWYNTKPIQSHHLSACIPPNISHMHDYSLTISFSLPNPTLETRKWCMNFVRTWTGTCACVQIKMDE